MSKSVAAQLHVLILSCSPAWSLNSSVRASVACGLAVEARALQPAQIGAASSGVRKGLGEQLKSWFKVAAYNTNGLAF